MVDMKKWHSFKNRKYDETVLKELLFVFADEALKAARAQTDYPSWRVFLLEKGHNHAGIMKALKRYPDVYAVYEELMKTMPELKVLAARSTDRNGKIIIPWQLVKLDLGSNHGWVEKSEKRLGNMDGEALNITVTREIIGKRDE